VENLIGSNTKAGGIMPPTSIKGVIHVLDGIVTVSFMKKILAGNA
jgi:hypothetical protein